MQAALRREPADKPHDMLQAAILRKKWHSEEYIGSCLGRAQSTISGWLHRIHSRGLEGRYDCKSPGRRCKLSDGQQEEIRGNLSEEPHECGLESGIWTSTLLALYIRKKFGVRYVPRVALKLARRLGFSVRKPRPVHYKTATPEKLKEYVQDTTAKIVKYAEAGYEIFCLDAAGITNSGSAQRGLRRTGGTDTVKVNFSKKSIKMLGALGSDGKYRIHFCQKADSLSVVELLEDLRARYGKILVILDNASAHKLKAIKEHLEKTNGDIVLHYLPPYTPQHNPIEMLWRGIKRAISGRYFEGGFEQMEKSIRRMLKEGEVCIVKLLDYMLDAIKKAKAQQS